MARVKAKFVTVWDDGVTLKSNCEFDTVTKEVWDIEQYEIDLSSTLQEEYVEFGCHTYHDFKNLDMDPFSGDFDPLYEELNECLQSVMTQVKIINSLSKAYPDSESLGNFTTNDLAVKLKGIYAAFTTGNENDRSNNDEIFK